MSDLRAAPAARKGEGRGSVLCSRRRYVLRSDARQADRSRNFDPSHEGEP